MKATPVASAIIADKKVDPKTVTPSGYQGKILKDDVLAALSNPGKITGGKALFSRDEKREKMSQSAQNHFAQAGRSKEYNGHAHHF